ncbi:lysosomal proton-coupled steroid conjugate and bile acid symporter SLC46A3-like [Planococcus citri]|uniref:lysosomal proton-coupled steroid conjugate and bile acid symporter SLC46A3-like n=1 Tax=Planococcus citri TaxID=170843 RepID=UPI0031F9CD5D
MVLLKKYNVIKNITVEPALLFYFLTCALMDVLDTNLYLQKACRFNTTSEPNLDTPCDDEKQGILFVSSVNGSYRFWEYMVMLALVTLSLSWSDVAGKQRKVLIIWPIIGLVVQSINGSLQSYFWTWSPLMGALVEMASQAFSGGFLMVFFAAQLYICDITSPVDRTMRTGILLSVTNICHPIGTGVAGFLIRGIGFFYSFSLCVLMSVISLVCAVLFIDDISVPVENKVSILGVFNFTRIVDSFRITFKKSLGKKRIVVLFLVLVHIVVLFSNEGEKTVFYLWVRYKFKWDERMFSVYQSYKMVGIIVGTMFCSIILSRILKIHDGIIGTFAGFWDMLAALSYIFATELWHLYLIPLLDIFHGTAIAICFSFLTKFYDSDEFGRINAVYMSFTLLVPFCLPVYNFIFQKTLDTFPSAIFVVSVIIDIIVCLLYEGAYFLTKKFENEPEVESRTNKSVCENTSEAAKKI